ncbi:MAG: hypothetical protein DMG45_17750 [Acidobacteria bacterium]|nr:MAG: hypothetical protein DMG45_17750 [Acidobacteriota bacterium]
MSTCLKVVDTRRLPANILADQDLNMPPRIVVMDRETKQKTTLLDLNPQFAELAFGKVLQSSHLAKWKKLIGRMELAILSAVGSTSPLNISRGSDIPWLFRRTALSPAHL